MIQDQKTALLAQATGDSDPHIASGFETFTSPKFSWQEGGPADSRRLLGFDQTG